MTLRNAMLASALLVAACGGSSQKASTSGSSSSGAVTTTTSTIASSATSSSPDTTASASTAPTSAAPATDTTIPAPGPSDTTPPTSGHPLTIVDKAFQPKNLTIAAGDTVTAANTGNLEHSWTIDNVFSKDLFHGDSFPYTFSSPGVFAFHCRFHPEMTGTLTVT